jgi:translation initiation factor 2B subunit (eIF-2B alpha/beta/delta family)
LALRSFTSVELLKALAQSGKYVDPIAVGELTSRIISAVSHDAEAVQFRSREQLLSFIEGLSANAIPHAVLSNAFTVATEVVDSAGSFVEALRRLRLLSSMIKDYIKNIVRQGVRNACSTLPHVIGKKRLSVAFMGYSSLLLDCIDAIKNLIYYINIIEGRPQGDGVISYRSLLRDGLKPRLYPDLSASRAVGESDVLFSILDTVSYEGYALIRMGLKQSMLIARDMGIPIVGVIPRLAFTATHPVTPEHMMANRIYVQELNDYIMIRLYDKIKLEILDYLVTEKNVARADSVDVEEEAYSITDEFIERIVGE